MPILTGASQLKGKFDELVKKGRIASQASVTVGHTQNYALYVHEIPANHVVGEVEYLLKAVKAVEASMRDNIVTAYRNGATLEQALLLGGLRIQRESQNRTPVDTGALKASAFTDLTANVEAAAAKAYSNAETIRARTLKSRTKAKQSKKTKKGRKK